MTEISWGHSALELVLDLSQNSPVSVSHFGNRSDVKFHVGMGQPLIEILTSADGRSIATNRMVRSAVGDRLRYVRHESTTTDDEMTLTIFVQDEESGLQATSTLTSWEGISGLRAFVTVTNASAEANCLLLSVPSWSSGTGISLREDGKIGAVAADAQLLRGSSDWLAEGRWERISLRNRLLPNVSQKFHGQNARGRYSEASTGTWSTGEHLPVALLESEGGCWGWQVENNGPWRWELGEGIDASYISLSGPTDIDHQWSRQLEPGTSFTSVAASVVVGSNFQSTISALTDLRRAGWRKHPDRESMGVIFNDYMNTLMGDPTTTKLLPLIDAAADVGCEIFCIDAGWYDDDSGWWDGVGEWQPSGVRFPGGLGEVLDRIRSRGMVAGLWLEPEVVGIRSPIALSLPDAAFFTRKGSRIVEHGRYHLDFSHPSVPAHLDEVIDRLVTEFQIGYFKLDYNINPGAGTDRPGTSVGDALLSHTRAYLGWLDRVMMRHPNLILENCSSGAMRMDFAMLSRLQLQSTSDQQDYLRYPAIAAAAPMMMPPEQAANWAYPQPDMSDEQIAFCLCTGILGRFFLSGYLSQMTNKQRQMVEEAIGAHKKIRTIIRNSEPLWPLGLPGWDDSWISVGIRPKSSSILYVTLWKRSAESGEIVLELPHLMGHDIEVEIIFPQLLSEWQFDWDSTKGQLNVRADSPGSISARTIKIESRLSVAKLRQTNSITERISSEKSS